MDATITFPLFGDWLVINIPRYFTVFGFNIYYYGLIITLGFTMAVFYIAKRRKLFNITIDNVLDILLIAVPCGLIGARIYYMIFNPEDFFGPGKWQNMWAFRDGGLAVYGGIIVSGLVFILYSRKKKIPLGNLLDAAAFGLFIGQAIGRWGNFINREAYGTATDLPWKMGLTRAGGTTDYVHPTFLYESLWNVAGLLIMHIFSKKSKTKYPGQYFLFYVAWYGLGRFMIEGLRIDSLYIPGTSLRVSQWLAAASFIIAVGILLYKHFYGYTVDFTMQEELIEQEESEVQEDSDVQENVETLEDTEKQEDSETQEDTKAQEDLETQEDSKKQEDLETQGNLETQEDK